MQLLADTTENVTITATKQITLDLNGYTLNGGTGTAKATILNKGNVTITDTSADKTGTIKRDDQGVEGETSYYVIIKKHRSMVRPKGMLRSQLWLQEDNLRALWLVCLRFATVMMIPGVAHHHGTFKQPNFLVVKNGSNGTLTVNGGTLASNHFRKTGTRLRFWAVA